jgi:DNA polymerase-3 subunit alpha
MALAITEHGSMSSSIKFHTECKANNIKPIQGIEFYICPPGLSSEDKSPTNRRLNHLVVLAKNEKGFQNLLRLTSLANAQERFYHRPRIDEELLFQNSEGLIILNGHYDTSIFDCLFYNIDGVSKSSNLDEAKAYLYPDYKDRFVAVANRYKSIFGDDFYIECQLFDPTDIVQQLSGHLLYSLAKEFGFNAVGTGDVHYISPKDCEAHATFVAIKQQKKIKDLPDIGYFKSGKYCLITNEEAQKYYPQELIDATSQIVNKIEDFEITRPQSIPKIKIDGISTIDEVKRICNEQLIKKGLDNPEYRARLEYELSIVELGELEHYFLIVSDYIKWAEQNDIFVGRSRGSSAGSLVCLLLNIIKTDPVKNGLSFERFYSPDRAESKILPDIDSDFQATRRDEIVEYIRHKYGVDRVCGVVTFNVLQAKSAIKDVLRVWDVCDFKTQNDIADLFEAKDKISDQLAEFKAETGHESMIVYTLTTNPDLLKDYCHLENGELKGEYAKFFDLAIQLEGSTKSISRHPSAYIICDRPIMEIAPLTKDSKTAHLLCALDMYSFELAGLVKFDILGIKSLDGLYEVNQLIKDIDIGELSQIEENYRS